MTVSSSSSVLPGSLKSRAAMFADRWRGRGSEVREARTFWIDLLEHVLGVPDVTDPKVVEFERRTDLGGQIDVFLPSAGVAVEMKSHGVDLDRPEERQGVMKTPARQLYDYIGALPAGEHPSMGVVCSFDVWRVYDLDADPTMRRRPLEFTLDELPRYVDVLARRFRHDDAPAVVREDANVEAGRRVAALNHALLDAWLRARHTDRLDERDHTMLAWLTVRIVFSLYADGAGLYPDGAFTRLVRDARDLNRDLADLFETLDLPEDNRPMRLAAFDGFPYVDGGLFADTLDIPPLDDTVRDAIVRMADGYDWSVISPVVFGSLMEETLSHDERRAGGMHYTSVRNIHRLIDPLFLDGLKDELRRIKGMPRSGGRVNALRRYHDRLASLTFLDPACGSGNFLTETYLCLRRLENEVIGELDHDNQYRLDIGGDYDPIRVSIANFHGVEINGFACAVAKTALWIAEQQAFEDTSSLLRRDPKDRLPFRDSPDIRCANALRTDWNTILDGRDCDYVMGNPPFIGQYRMTPEQKTDMKTVWGDQYDGYLDYATGWLRKATDYCAKPGAAFAFVATNSICCGRPVAPLFRPLKDAGWHIGFAWRSFKWDAQSTDKAGVAVVIVGMTRVDGPRALYGGDGVRRMVDNINPYLVDARDVFVEPRRRPFCNQQRAAVRGLQPSDGGALLVAEGLAEVRLRADPVVNSHLRPCIGADELLTGRRRDCLWLADANPKEMRDNPFIRERIERCRDMRLKSRKPATRRMADTPWLFQDWNKEYPHDSPLLVLPSVSSENRRYLPCGLEPKGTIVTNLCYVVADPDGLQFAIRSNRMYALWLGTVGGRLESRYRLTNTIVDNTLPLPDLDEATIAAMTDVGNMILKVRANHPESSLSDLYDPVFMPADLRRAHEALDRVADVAFGAPHWLRDDDAARLTVLFDAYAKLES